MNSDFRDLLAVFNAHGVRYLIVGGYAVMRYMVEPRFTKDLDVWIDPAPENAQRVFAALAEFGAPLKGMKPEDLVGEDVFYQVGVYPNRIDVFPSMAGADFSKAWEAREEGQFGGIPVTFVGFHDLINAKRAAGRPQDLVDIGSMIKADLARQRNKGK